ncbi:hypothetical protein BKA59DRAFT_517654 [Fusarium tricinctum]|uniref:Uncharacterized protein n=1 Tax=Fusarium tricinctum TaxID=61284 RepID=A0A8K0RKZ9_9HYPO|nr:hypothetical protein BKA59DRAFT_517654 [Fusarium tricinctum]
MGDSEDFIVPLPPGSAERFPAAIDLLSQKPSWKDATMQGVIRRLKHNIGHVKKDMIPHIADSLTFHVIEYLEGMTPRIAQDITKSPVYRTVLSSHPPSKAIIYPAWFFLASIYGPDHKFPADKVSCPHILSKHCKEASFQKALIPQGQNGPVSRVSATANEKEMSKTVPKTITVIERPLVDPSCGEEMRSETHNVKGLLDKLRALPDRPVVSDRLVTVEEKIQAFLSQNGDRSKDRAKDEALAKTQKDVEALQSQIKKFVATIDSQSQKIHDLEEENKAIRTDFRNLQSEVNDNISKRLAGATVSLGSTIENTETNIRSEIHTKICKVEKGFGESTNTLKAQIERQNHQLSEQILRINELEQVADQVVSKVASLFKRKSDEDPKGSNEDKRQRT